jgi:hypothetical protein
MQLHRSHGVACSNTHHQASSGGPRSIVARSRSTWRQSGSCCSRGQQPQTVAQQQQQTVGVHVAAVPLVGPFEAAERALGRLYPDQLALHTVVILEESDGTCTAYDFLPLQPTLPLTISR